MVAAPSSPTRSSGSAAAAAEARREAEARARAAEAARRRAEQEAARHAEAARRAQATRQAEAARQADRLAPARDPAAERRAAQARMLGGASRPTPEQAARTDAERVAQAAAQGPVAGAEALEQALRSNEDPAYRRALGEAARPTVEAMGQTLGSACFADDTQARTLGPLARAAELAGPEAKLGEALVAGMPHGAQDPGFVAALGQASRTPGSARLGAEVSRALGARGDHEAAQQIATASPELRALTEVDQGAAAADAAVEVDGEASAEERAGLQEDLGKTDRATRAQVDDLFARADVRPLPAGTTATVDGDRVELITRDRQGRVTSREVGERDGDEVTYERTDYRGGYATRQSYQAEGDEVTVTTADWAEPASATPSSPSWDELSSRAEGGEAGIALREVSYRDTDDGLQTREKVVTEEGKNEVTRTYRDQTGGDGIIDALEDQLDTDQAIHVVETESTSQLWGEDEEKSREWTYEQGDVRISAADGEGDDVPKQWRLEKQAGDVYRAQTFVEGSEDFTTITERRSDGRTVTETSTSRGTDEDGEAYEVASTSHTTFGDDGQVVGQHLDRTEPDGSRSVLDYSRTTDAQGQSREVTRSELTDAEGRVTSAERESHSVMVNGQEKVTSLRTTVHGPGGTATSTFTERGGQQLTVNGKPVPLAEGSPELDALSEEEKELAAQAATDVLKNVKTAAEQGKNVLELTKVTGVGANPNYTRGDALPDALNRKLELNKIRLGQRFGEARVEATQEALLRGASGAKAGVGALGALASGAALISDIQQHNWLKAGIDAGGVAVGGANVVAGVRELSALRATPNGALAIDDLGSVAGKFGTFAKFGGLAVGLAAGGYQVVDGIVKGDGVSIAQGGVGIAGTLGAFAAGGAVGGPAGVLVGVGIGLATLGVQWGIGKIWGDDAPAMADVAI